MAADDLWALLARVGLSRRGGALDALADPVATDALATLLADRLRPRGATLVVVWDGLSNAVLGYAVALRLGVAAAVLSDDEGLVSSATPLRPGMRAVLVAGQPPDDAATRMAAGFLTSRSGTLVAVASLVAPPDDRDGLIALATLAAPERGPASLSGPAPDLAPGYERRPAPGQDRR